MKEEKKISGWTPLPNTLLEGWALEKLSGRKLRIKIFVYRKTIGFGKAEDLIPYSQYKAGCGIGKRHAYTLVQEMIEEKHLIINNGKIRLALTSEQWKIVTEYGNGITLPFQGKSVTVLGGKIVTVPGNLITKAKQIYQNKRGIASQLSREEIDKLEGPEWFRAIMINDGGFDYNFIDQLIKTYPYSVLCNSWYEYIEADNIKNKTGFFYSLVKKYQEDQD